MLLFSCFFGCPDVPVVLVVLVDLGRQKCGSGYMWWNRARKGDHIFVCTTRILPVGHAFSSGSAAGKSGKTETNKMKVMVSANKTNNRCNTLALPFNARIIHVGRRRRLRDGRDA